jgi:hypothetical protein
MDKIEINLFEFMKTTTNEIKLKAIELKGFDSWGIQYSADNKTDILGKIRNGDENNVEYSKFISKKSAELYINNLDVVVNS